MTAHQEPEFEIVLSFAGAERAYARAIHDICVDNGIRVFLDEEFQHDMWGKSLVEYLDDTYRRRGAYCVMLISAAYRERAYGRLERRAAFDRMLEQPSEYILPVRVDDTQIPGLARSLTYVDLRVAGVLGVCELVIHKLTGEKRTLTIPEHLRIPRVPSGAIPAEHLRTYLTELCRNRAYVVFGVLVYDETTAELRKVLQDRDYWDALDTSSGPDFEIFAIRDRVDSATEPFLEMMTLSSMSRAQDHTRYFSHLLKTYFHEEAQLAYPSVLLFIAAGGAILQSRLLPLERGTAEQTFHRLQGLVTLVAKGIEQWKASGAGTDKLWETLKGKLLSDGYTIYIQTAPRDAPVAIAELTRFVESS